MFQNMRLTLGLTSPRVHEPPLSLTPVSFESSCHGYTIHLVTACFEFFCKLKIPYSLKEKILLASLIHDMEEAIENKKTDTVSVERKNSV
jgi:hypothetical protein